MSRFEWRDRGEDRRAWRNEPTEREDFGQADYSRDYAYDPESRTGYRREERLRTRNDDYRQADRSQDLDHNEDRDRPYRRFAEEDVDLRRDQQGHIEDPYEDERYAEARPREARDRGESRSWMDRAGGFLTGRSDVDEGRLRRRRGPSDRVLWAVIVERLEDERGLDLRDVEVLVDDAEVTLNGTVRRKEEKRRIEDIADIEGVRHVQNNLRVRDRGHWTFL